ncbi:MAG: hypothetical protein WCF06_06265 [Nitrososphaeraceae archaeon]
MRTNHNRYKMKPLETLFWLGTAGVLYMAANTIVKNVAKDVVKDVFKETERRSDHDRCLWW